MIRRTLIVVGGYKYEHFLPTIIEKYNESPHRGIFNYTPKQLYVEGIKTKKSIIIKTITKWIKTYKSLLKKGNKVPIARLKNNSFEKSSLQRWTNETFTINKVYITDPVTYTLKDLNNEEITGIFYREELQRI